MSYRPAHTKNNHFCQREFESSTLHTRGVEPGDVTPRTAHPQLERQLWSNDKAEKKVFHLDIVASVLLCTVLYIYV